MRVCILPFIVGLTCATPQGYKYQIEVAPSGQSLPGISNLFQLIQQQQQSQNEYQEQIPQSQELGEILSLNQFNNQLLQNDQEINQYEQRHHKELDPIEEQQQNFEQDTSVVEQPSAEIADTIESSQPSEKSEIIIDTQPQFTFRSKEPIKPLARYHAPVEEKPVSFQKEFFYLSAPQEEDETPKAFEDQLSGLQKKLRVVFIKAPENNAIEKAALQLAKQTADSQTAIYVLTKQQDTSELAEKFQSIQSSRPQSPDVSFIKYRTPEEAEHAQRVIQAQFESLDGPNRINKPVIGVTHNFVGANADVVGPRKPLSVVAYKKLETTKPISRYLPASTKH